MIILSSPDGDDGRPGGHEKLDLQLHFGKIWRAEMGDDEHYVFAIAL